MARPEAVYGALHKILVRTGVRGGLTVAIREARELATVAAEQGFTAARDAAAVRGARSPADARLAFVRELEEEVAAVAPRVVAEPPPEAPPEAPDGGEVPAEPIDLDTVTLGEMTRAELLDVAKQLDMSGVSRLSKEDLLVAITARRDELAGSGPEPGGE